jgi:alpha-amylase
VYNDSFNKAYGPLIENLFKYSTIKFTLHFSGNLLEWFLKNKPDIIKKLKIMSKRGQIEIIGGGYYEPIFSIIPYRDRIAQMKKLSNLIKAEFGLEVNGAWLSERVWEPNYPSFLSDAGLKYVIVDDNHLRSCGLMEEDTLYTYITEDEGKSIRIFPINEPLRYLTPWKPTYYTIDYLKKIANDEGTRMALLIDDAEKMGVWGTTHDICYVEGCGHTDGDNKKPFIPAFFEQISKNKWIKSITLSEYMKKYPARGLIYFPTASYDKMEEWVLPTPVRKKFELLRDSLRDKPERNDEYMFLKGGFWRFFLVKYPESNNMHKKMLYVREKLIQVEKSLDNVDDQDLISELKPKIDQAWDEIYKAQCNDAYWHGMFGGVYLQFLRFSIYTHLINAEKIIDELLNLISSTEKAYITTSLIDFDYDSTSEILIESSSLNLYINQNDGGTIFELDYKPKSYNLLNTLTRWIEAYHNNDKINNDEVMIDRYKRNMLRIRFLNENTSLTQLQTDKYFEWGDFADGRFKIIKNEKDGLAATIILENEGNLKVQQTDEIIPCKISNTIMVENNKILIRINGSFENSIIDEEILDSIFNNYAIAVDFPFFFNGDPNKFTWQYDLMDFNNEKEKDLMEPFQYYGENFKAYDETYDLNLELLFSCNTGKIKINKFPIIAYVFTDQGYKKIYQGINVTPQFKFDKTFEFNIELHIT